MRTALGFRAHSGWAAMVAAAGTIDAPRVIDRRRLIIADPKIPGSRQPYHAAADLPFATAGALVHNAIESSCALASEAIAASVRSLQSNGHEVTACAILWNSSKPLPELERILASHALIHAAEGQMFRDALVAGAQASGLPVLTITERDVGPELLKYVHSLGRLIGPPWTQEQKYSTLAALIALARLPPKLGA